LKVAAIICEYNPFHNGHARQFSLTRQALGEDALIVCLMSGNYVQRGAPAVFDKMCRAEAALACGADLVLENSVTNVLRSAEGYAAGGVQILTQLGGIDCLSFGVESGTAEELMQIASLLRSDAFSAALRPHLDEGLSFAAARERAAEDLGADASLLRTPNAILGIEYCKAILQQESSIRPLTVLRGGDYHALEMERENPSATSIRLNMAKGEAWYNAVPEAARQYYEGQTSHTLARGEQAMLAVLRTMSREAYEQLPHGSEGLWSKFYRLGREVACLEELAEAVKSKRYARTRIDRMILCAYLGITREMLEKSAPYVRVLGFRPSAQKLLRAMRDNGAIPLIHAGERAPDREYEQLEMRCADLFTFFAGKPEYGTLQKERPVIFPQK